MWRSARADKRDLQFEEKREAQHNEFMAWWKEQHKEHQERHQETMRGFERQEQESRFHHEEVMAEIHSSSASGSGDKHIQTGNRERAVIRRFEQSP